MRRETQIGKVGRDCVPPPELLTAMTRWARHAVWGCELVIAWGQLRDGSVAHVIRLTPKPGFDDYQPARDRAVAQRFCALITSLQLPFTRLMTRGLTVDDSIDLLSLAWTLERQETRQVRVGTARSRAREAQTLREAAALASKWQTLLEKRTPWIRVEDPDGRRRATYFYRLASELLPWLADFLGTVESRRGQPAHSGVLICVRVLQALLRRRRANATAREIAAVPAAAWPDGYRPGEFETAATARKLLARARKDVSDETLKRAFDVLPSSVRALRPSVSVPLKDGSGTVGLIFPSKPRRRVSRRRAR